MLKRLIYWLFGETTLLEGYWAWKYPLQNGWHTHGPSRTPPEKHSWAFGPYATLEEAKERAGKEWGIPEWGSTTARFIPKRHRN